MCMPKNGPCWDERSMFAPTVLVFAINYNFFWQGLLYCFASENGVKNNCTFTEFIQVILLLHFCRIKAEQFISW